MSTLVALDLPGGQAFVDALQSVWASGDAVFPLDQRLPDVAKTSLIERMGVGAIIGNDRERRHLHGGRPTEAGDALVVATSGSTGQPKGVVLTHAAVEASARVTSAYLAVERSDHWLACLPLAHVGGLSVITRALYRGTRLTVLPRFCPDDVMASGATFVSLVGTALTRVDPTRFRKILLGGSRPPTDRPANSVTTYGMTETGSGVVYDGVPLPGVDVRVQDGELQLRGPMMLRCYRDGTNPYTSDGWLPTGDLGAITDDGAVEVYGRQGDLIISGGENVWPEPVEAILATHRSVVEAAVVARPDPVWGQAVTAVVVPTSPHAVPSLDELRALVKAVLPAYCAPHRLEVSEGLARTSLGKLRRSQASGVPVG